MTSTQPTRSQDEDQDQSQTQSQDPNQELKYTPPPHTTTTSPVPTPTAPPSEPNISLRTYIYFLPHPLPPNTPIPYTPGLPARNPLNLPPHAFEPTDTLVLTSPGKTFVDLRYLKPTSSAEAVAVAVAKGAVLKQRHLEWGFAGSSSSVASASSPHAEYGVFTQNEWVHWVDSRVGAGREAARDEGVVFSLGEGRFVEYGTAFQMELGRVAGHEEGWVDVDVHADADVDVDVDAQGEKRNFKSCVVLRVHDDSRGVRGVVVRVGQYVQGIVQVGDRVATERWEYRRAGERGSEGGWQRTARTGDWFLPCAVTWRAERVVVGGVVRYMGFEWVVEECWVWE